MGHFRDRIKELRRVRAGDLRPCPWNWRDHPPEQREALEAILAEVGFAGAGLARELEDGSLELIDGHMRAELDLDQEMPVLILDGRSILRLQRKRRFNGGYGNPTGEGCHPYQACLRFAFMAAERA